MNAARHKGLLHLTALGHAPGAQCNQNNSIQANTNASPTPHPMASHSEAVSDIRNSFAFVARAMNSIRSLLRSVVAATCASNSLARPMLAGADRGGV